MPGWSCVIVVYGLTPSLGGRLHKGQLFLNGRNLGRYWQIGGFCNGHGVQGRYLLPHAWLRDENSLAIFEEYGLPRTVHG